jgi:hypothetical protein
VRGDDASEVFDGVEMVNAEHQMPMGDVVVEAADIKAERRAQVAFIQQRVELYNAGGGSVLTQYIAGRSNTRVAREESLALFQCGGMVFAVREVGTTAKIVKDGFEAVFEEPRHPGCRCEGCG